MINSILSVTFSSVMQTVGSIAVAVLILVAMITVHEAGHYTAGKILKFGVDEFSIGFGPALFKRKNARTGEQFSIRAVPLGGYCMFTGEEEEAEATLPLSEGENVGNVERPQKGSVGVPFTKMAPWKRIIVLVAGPLMNYILALLCIMVLFFSQGQYEYKIYNVAVGDYPAAYSLQVGDIITSVDGKNMYVLSDYVSALNGKSEGDKVDITVIRDGAEEDIEVILRGDADFKNLSDAQTLLSALGISEMGGVPVRFGFFQTLGRSFVYSAKVGGTILQTLGELLTGKLGLSAMGGPITTISVTSQYATQSFASFLEITATIGVNLAVFNLLPIPALDGSKIIFTVIEWIRRKPINRKVESVISAAGFILMIVFAVLVDILHFI